MLRVTVTKGDITRYANPQPKQQGKHKCAHGTFRHGIFAKTNSTE